MIIEFPYEIGTEVYYACAWGVESGVIGHYEVFKDAVYAMDENGSMLSCIEDLHDSYESAYEEYESKYAERMS